MEHVFIQGNNIVIQSLHVKENDVDTDLEDTAKFVMLNMENRTFSKQVNFCAMIKPTQTP